MARLIRAFTTLDCAYKTRVRYELPRPLTKGVAGGFSGVVTVNEFSKQVAGAKDHVSIKQSQMYAGGVIGECWLVATFGKLDGCAPDEVVVAFEHTLRRLYQTHIVSMPRGLAPA